MALTTGKTAAKYGLSRTALLYYDKLGLVSPTARAANGYRLYSDEDQQRLRQVLLYRDVGIPLEQMPSLLAAGEDTVHGLLFGRLYALSQELAAIKAKQLAVIGMMADNLRRTKVLDEAALHNLLRAAGVDREQARALHRTLEESAPQAHEKLLQALGFAPEEIAEIRRHYTPVGEADHGPR